jgi:hypothetical protein
MTKKIHILFIIRHLAAKPTIPGAKPTRPGTEVNCNWSFVTELKL